MKNTNWDDLRILLLVAEGGGLSFAARELKVSVPTVGRRMLALEEAVGKPLFNRSQAGYTLTKAGEELASKSLPIRAAARAVDEWLAPEIKRPLVRVSAGTGTAGFLASHFSTLWNNNDLFQIAFVTAEAVLDIAHRQVDIGIRNQQAETGNLASRKLQEICFAPFKNRHAEWNDQPAWVAIDGENAKHPAAHWVLKQKDVSIKTWANSAATMHSLVLAGAGVGIMPCFMGDRNPVLKRAGPIIEDLTETQWLVMHGDDRHRSEIRTVADRITNLLHRHSALLSGQQPIL